MSDVKQINVVKIGGNVIDNPDALERFVCDFAKMPAPKILIHGGGKLATRLSEKLEIPTRMIEGRRVTDSETLDIVTMVYAGLVNKKIVAKLQAVGCNAIGLSGADANSVPAVRRSPVPVDFGFVGDIDATKINTGFIAALLNAGITPVFCAITHDAKGSLLNSNADSVASSVAVASTAIAPVYMHFCFEKIGVFRYVDDETSLIREILPETYIGLRDAGVVSKGMIPKIDNAFSAVEAGVKSVIIKHSDNLLSDIGTVIRL